MKTLFAIALFSFLFSLSSVSEIVELQIKTDVNARTDPAGSLFNHLSPLIGCCSQSCR